MTDKDIQERIKDIAKVAQAGDYEVAHSDEDTLVRDVLEAIAAGGPAGLASAVLSVYDLPFPRYCA